MVAQVTTLQPFDEMRFLLVLSFGGSQPYWDDLAVPSQISRPWLVDRCRQDLAAREGGGDAITSGDLTGPAAGDVFGAVQVGYGSKIGIKFRRAAICGFEGLLEHNQLVLNWTKAFRIAVTQGPRTSPYMIEDSCQSVLAEWSQRVQDWGPIVRLHPTDTWDEIRLQSQGSKDYFDDLGAIVSMVLQRVAVTRALAAIQARLHPADFEDFRSWASGQSRRSALSVPLQLPSCAPEG